METSNKTPELCLAELLSDAAQKKVLKKAVLSKSADKSVIRAVITKKLISGKDMLQVEKFTSDNKALHSNLYFSDIDALAELFSDFAQINLITTAGDAELKRSKSGKVTLIGEKKLARALSGELSETLPDSGNDQIKNHILSGNEAFLKLLGVSDENGRIFDKKRSKFRQINKFLEHIRDIVKHLSSNGTLYVCDLCCGKSYLSFAAYYYLSAVLGRSVKMVGVDLKEDVIDYCNGICELLGFDGLRFVCGDITKYTPEQSPELVISLHACDTATDIVLGKAIEWNSRVILSTPCCHHELNHTINCEALAFVTEHSMLRQKLCDAATDAMRLKLLEANGYITDALELIDPEETPKNILLRAIRRYSPDSPRCIKALDEYNAARAFLLGKKI